MAAGYRGLLELCGVWLPQAPVATAGGLVCADVSLAPRVLGEVSLPARVAATISLAPRILAEVELERC